MKRFPCGEYGRQRLTFYPAPFKAPLRSFAVLVFPWIENKVVICDIADRGWCIPSGRVEPGETSLQAACREAQEEAGIAMAGLQYMGCYQISERREVRWADCYTGRVSELADIVMKEESRGRQAITICELPSVYHVWNELTECVFRHAYEIVCRQDGRPEFCCPPPSGDL